VPPFLIAVARVVEHDHYLSDVTASIALAALLAIAFKVVLRRRDRATTEHIAG
jgi:membrane-associated phospholipid phosphatase